MAMTGITLDRPPAFWSDEDTKNALPLKSEETSTVNAGLFRGQGSEMTFGALGFCTPGTPKRTADLTHRPT